MVQVVLTADSSLMSEYGGSMFLGFAACVPKLLPEVLYRWLTAPPVPHKNGVALRAPYGLRKVEAVLIENSFNVVVAHPEHIHKVVRKDTKVVGISSFNPLGLGPASTTLTKLMRKESYSAIFFKKLIERLRSLKSLKIVVGGPGAWQLVDESILAKFGIDCLMIGESEVSDLSIIFPEGFQLPLFTSGFIKKCWSSGRLVLS